MLYTVVLGSIACPDSSDPAQDTLQMKERCDALKSAHEAVIERGQAEELQMQHDEQAAQAKKMNIMLFFLTVGSTIFTPVYGMNFENTSGTPTIPFLLEEEGYTYFWYGVLVYFTLAISFVVMAEVMAVASTASPQQRRSSPLLFRSPFLALKGRLCPLMSTATKSRRVTCIQGETGCGKSSRVPQYVYHLCRQPPKRPGDEKLIVCTQPRRLAALTLSQRVAKEMGLDLMLFSAIAIGYDVMFSFLIGWRLHAATFRRTDSFRCFFAVLTSEYWKSLLQELPPENSDVSGEPSIGGLVGFRISGESVYDFRPDVYSYYGLPFAAVKVMMRKWPQPFPKLMA
eukprot:s835_g19.t1